MGASPVDGPLELSAPLGGRPTPSLDRLSVPRVRTSTRRKLTAAEVSSFRRVANALIPPVDGHAGAGELSTFPDVLHEALSIVDPDLEALPALATGLDAIPEDLLIAGLKAMNERTPDAFYLLSLCISGAYLYAPEIESELAYPLPHANPIDIGQIADDLESGILDPVMERGQVFRAAD